MNTIPPSALGCMDRYGTAPFVSHHQLPQSDHFGTSQNQHQHSPLSRSQQKYLMGSFTQNPIGWTGVPLISTAVRRSRKNHYYSNSNNNNINQKQRLLVSGNSTEFDENAMSRLAIHAHGAPLILSGRYRNRINKREHFCRQINSNSCFSTKGKVNNNNNENHITNILNIDKSAATNKKAITLPDSVSVTSDECSSNGTLPDVCLPRIIKPRKRRKKDRKAPNVCLPVNNGGGVLFSEASLISITNIKEIANKNVLTDLSKENNQTKGSESKNIPELVMEDLSPQLEINYDHLDKFQTFRDDIISSCYCRLCDPFCGIWAFPLRRSFSDNSADIEIQQKNKDVGVIGSNRSLSSRNEWRSNSHIEKYHLSSTNENYSDSTESGCDILNGINICEDIFTANNPEDSLCTNNKLKAMNDGDFIDFSTAESLLTESINEISKKLMDTIDLRNDLFSSSDNSSSFSDNVLSDDILRNFENIKYGAKLFCDENVVFKANSVQENSNKQIQKNLNKTNHNKSLFYENNLLVFPENDWENKLNKNCCVLKGPKLLPVKERAQLQSNG